MEELKGLSPPEPLAARHRVDDFHCGERLLDEWLRRHALANQSSGASRTFVIHSRNRVVGYYALAAGSVARTAAPRRLKRNRPDPIPVVVLGRLAIDSTVQRRGLGSALLQDAVLRCRAAAAEVGIAGILVHALSEDGRGFYEHAGFVRSPIHPLTLLLPMAAIDAAIAAP